MNTSQKGKYKRKTHLLETKKGTTDQQSQKQSTTEHPQTEECQRRDM
jgi:hypothetical protein